MQILSPCGWRSIRHKCRLRRQAWDIGLRRKSRNLARFWKRVIILRVMLLVLLLLMRKLVLWLSKTCLMRRGGELRWMRWKRRVDRRPTISSIRIIIIVRRGWYWYRNTIGYRLLWIGIGVKWRLLMWIRRLCIWNRGCYVLRVTRLLHRIYGCRANDTLGLNTCQYNIRKYEV